MLRFQMKACTFHSYNHIELVQENPQDTFKKKKILKEGEGCNDTLQDNFEVLFI